MYARTHFLYHEVKSTFWGEWPDAIEGIDDIDAMSGDLIRNWHDNGPGAVFMSVQDVSALKHHSRSQKEDLHMRSMGLTLHMN